jgi:hypothetical protein
LGEGGKRVRPALTLPKRDHLGTLEAEASRGYRRYQPVLARDGGKTDAERQQVKTGFADFETDTVRHTFVLPSFDAYYGPFERGGASTGQALAALPEEMRRAIREEVRRDLADTGGPVKAEAEYRIASGRRQAAL